MVPLKDFAKDHGQPHAASLLGMTQGALSKAIRTGRVVYVLQQPDGSLAAIEVRSFPMRHDRHVVCGPTMDQTILQLASAVESGNTSGNISSAKPMQELSPGKALSG